jgi:hypothetical protein
VRYIIELDSDSEYSWFYKWVVDHKGNYPKFVSREDATRFDVEEAKEHSWHLTMHGYPCDMIGADV